MLNICKNQQEKMVGVLIGYFISASERECYFLQIFERQEDDNWKFIINVVLPPKLRYICHQFEFKNKDPKTLIFTTQVYIFEYHYEKQKLRCVFEFKNFLNCQPVYSVFNETQKMLLVATYYDVLLVDFIKENEIDIDEMYHIGDIKCIVNLKSKFYILANKCLRMLGYYLIEIDEAYPDQPLPQYIINWKSRLDFGDAQLFFLDDE